MSDPRDDGTSPGNRWVCYCGEVAPWSWTFPHWDCQGGRPLTPDEPAATPPSPASTTPGRLPSSPRSTQPAERRRQPATPQA